MQVTSPRCQAEKGWGVLLSWEEEKNCRNSLSKQELSRNSHFHPCAPSNQGDSYQQDNRENRGLIEGGGGIQMPGRCVICKLLPFLDHTGTDHPLNKYCLADEGFPLWYSIRSNTDTNDHKDGGCVHSLPSAMQGWGTEYALLPASHPHDPHSTRKKNQVVIISPCNWEKWKTFLDIIVSLLLSLPHLLTGDLDHPPSMSKYKLSASSHNHLSQKKESLYVEPSPSLLL